VCLTYHPHQHKTSQDSKKKSRFRSGAVSKNLKPKAVPTIAYAYSAMEKNNKEKPKKNK
jgi:hypothetical protein